MRPLPGAPHWAGKLEDLIRLAVKDARAYEHGGAHALFVENFGDAPFTKGRVAPETIAAMDAASRVVAVGTTSVRAIESDPASPRTDLFISPGFHFRRTNAMLTNFHLPKSSLLVLVCAFAGTDLMLAAYRYAVATRYRFFSYGDCMLIVG